MAAKQPRVEKNIREGLGLQFHTAMQQIGKYNALVELV